MRTIEWASQFKKDYKRESKGQHRADLGESLFLVVELLANDKPLEPRYWKDHRDCHIKPDLVLIYRMPSGCSSYAWVLGW
ncbi:type II toxin-antitoxin system YafQ family toxin [Azotobacter beijerinckii]|uniref:type II toxin-antitoxin system YafQ family toxin n=1 Tax=Azotobacter beijerinckii TaxID=170623 RepID=UPI0037BFE58E